MKLILEGLWKQRQTTLVYILRIWLMAQLVGTIEQPAHVRWYWDYSPEDSHWPLRACAFLVLALCVWRNHATTGTRRWGQGFLAAMLLFNPFYPIPMPPAIWLLACLYTITLLGFSLAMVDPVTPNWKRHA